MQIMRQTADAGLDQSLNDKTAWFSGQEVEHPHVHTAFNNILSSHGAPFDAPLAAQCALIERIFGRHGVSFDFAITATMEYLRAIGCVRSMTGLRLWWASLEFNR